MTDTLSSAPARPDGRVEGTPLWHRDHPERIGMLHWHERRKTWYVEFPWDGRLWEWPDGEWRAEAPWLWPDGVHRPVRPPYWCDQEIGLGVARCDEPEGNESQPQRRPWFKAGSERWVHIARRRTEGATYRQIGSELGVSVERVRQLQQAQAPRWCWE